MKITTFGTMGSEATSDAVQPQLNLSYRWRHNRPIPAIYRVNLRRNAASPNRSFAALAKSKRRLRSAVRTKRYFSEIARMSPVDVGTRLGPKCSLRPFRHFEARAIMTARAKIPYTIAKMRAGPPVPPRCFGAPITNVAPAAGTRSRLARHSMPNRPAGNQA